jgi:hypothetical protein
MKLPVIFSIVQLCPLRLIRRFVRHEGISNEFSLSVCPGREHDSYMTNHNPLSGALLSVYLICSGCVAIWQDDHKVETSDGSAVAIEYDPLLLGAERVKPIAQSECERFQKVAVLYHIEKGFTWTRVARFHCESEGLKLKGSIAS